MAASRKSAVYLVDSLSAMKRMNGRRRNWSEVYRFIGSSIMGICSALIAASRMAHAELKEAARSIPQSYEECRRSGPLTREDSALRCVYVLEPELTDRFMACLLRTEAYQQWTNQSCRIIHDQAVVHDQAGYGLICGSTLVGIFSGPCELIYYNPAYEFPQDYGACKARDGQLHQTYEAEPVCTVEVNLPPYYGKANKTVFNSEIGRRLMDACRAQGGNYELALGKYPECRKTFGIQTQ